MPWKRKKEALTSRMQNISAEAGHTGGLWHPFKGKDENGKYYDGMDENPNDHPFANGKPSVATI